MAKTNTEKPTGKSEMKKAVPAKAKDKKMEVVKNKVEASEKKTEVENKKTDTREKKDAKETKKPEVKKTKKESVKVISKEFPVSPKVGAAICRFLKNKKLKDAIKDMEKVAKMKKAVAMKGEIPHRKGKIMSGRYPVRAAKDFLVLLKSLDANSVYHDVDEPVIVEAICNKGETRYGRAGTQKKRSHVKIIASQIKKKEKEKK